MAKKFYAIRKGFTPGIYDNWDAAKAQINGFSGAEYKGFMTIEEAKAYLDGNENDQVREKALAHSNRANSGLAIANLKNVKINVSISREQQQLLERFVEEIIKTEENLETGENEEANEWEEIVKAHKDVDVVAFVDGSADKNVSNGYQSGKLGFGLVWLDVKNKKAKTYSYVYQNEPGIDANWLLEGSNDTAEIIVAVTAMRLCKENGYKSIRIYQDNERPAKYFSGEFKNINTAYGVWYIHSAIDAVQEMDVQYIYVPAHVKGPSDYAQKEKKYDAQGMPKVDFATAKHFNEMVDKLANVEDEKR